MQSNKKLQKYCIETHPQGLNLQIDVKKRWNSMFVMLCTFLLIQKEIQKAIIDCCRHDLFLTENEIRQAQSLTNVLEIVEMSTAQ